MSNKIHTAIRLQPPQPMHLAPTDGTHIYVLNPEDDQLYEVNWFCDGSSINQDIIAKTGVWMYVGGGWFQPDEVDYWYPM